MVITAYDLHQNLILNCNVLQSKINIFHFGIKILLQSNVAADYKAAERNDIKLHFSSTNVFCNSFTLMRIMS